MKRRNLLILAILLVAILSAGAYYIYYRHHVYDLEYLEPEVFEEANYDVDLLIGKWQSGSIFYRFDVDSTGVTWDESDDITEIEASPMKWELNRSKFIHYHEMQNGVLVPKAYKIVQLDLNNLVFQDDYGNEFAFIKVD